MEYENFGRVMSDAFMRYSFILLFLLSVTKVGLSQTDNAKPDSSTRVNDIFQPYGWIDYAAEYNTIDSKNSFLEHYFVYQPYLGHEQIVQIEFGLVHAFLDSATYFVPGDLTLSYQKVFFAKNEQKVGYQGVGVTMKLIIPTGSDAYLSGVDSWAIEPQFGVQWGFNNPNWLFALVGRYNYNFASLPNKEPDNSFFRLQCHLGIENDKWWGFVVPDYRFIPDGQRSTFFVELDLGYKITERLALRITAKPRLAGEDFVASVYTIGGFWYL
jgi:hypothetical protein